MAYTITTTAGVTLATIADGTVNTTVTSLTLIGKNYAGYGVFLNENYIKLLENFSNTTAPNAAIQGQLWYDKGQSVLKVYDGSAWKPISSSAAGASAPTGPIIGDLWWDTANSQLKVFSGSAWVTVGPAYTATSGTSGAVVETILDQTSSPHVVVKFYISNITMAILSKDSTFTPLTSIAGYTTIKPGFNLVGTSTVADAKFVGDASNALSLNGLTSSDFIRSNQNIITSYSVSAGGGLTVGSNLVFAADATKVTMTNSVQNGAMEFYINQGGTNTRAIGINGSTGLVTLSSNLAVNGGSITTTATTATVFNSIATTLNIGQSATAISMGAQTGTTTIRNALAVAGANVSVTSTNGNVQLIPATGTSGTAGYSGIEIGGASGAYVDLKSPANKDYDARVASLSGSGLVLSTIASTGGNVIISPRETTRLGILVDGSYSVNGNVGTAGQALLSAGSGQPVYWGSVAVGATGGGSNKIFWENDQTITVDYTISSNKNAMTAGPVTIATGITVTIPVGSTWSIV